MHIVADAAVAPLYLDRLQASFAAAGIASAATLVPSGEASKSFSQLETLLDALLDARVERKTTLVALGGGVIGDLTGFAAAIALVITSYSIHYTKLYEERCATISARF